MKKIHQQKKNDQLGKGGKVTEIILVFNLFLWNYPLRPLKLQAMLLLLLNYQEPQVFLEYHFIELHM